MIFTTQSIATHVEMQFPAHYCHFREFQESPDYRLYWDKCMEAVRDRELLSHIIFCNDLLRIPPIKTFLLYYEQDLNQNEIAKILCISRPTVSRLLDEAVEDLLKKYEEKQGRG